MGTSREKSLASAISRRSKDSKPSGFAAFLRIFSFARPIDHVYEFVSLVGAVGAGVAVALVNLVLGDLLNLISDYTTGAMSPSDFRTEAGKLSLYFVYIGIAKLVLTYIYSSLSTYAAYNITRNIRHAYFRSALSQEIVFFDCGGSGSIPMQAISNGKMIQSGIAEKLGLAVQAIATFFAAFIIAFISYWKLTLIIICIAPAIVIVIGTVAAIEGGVETKILQVYASSAAFAETALRNIRAINAFSLRPSIVSKYEGFLAKAKESGDRKSALYGIMFGGQNFIVFSGMGLAFWQGIGMIVSSEVQGIGTVFTVLFSVVIASTSVTAVAPHTVAFNRAAKAASELFELIDRKSEVNPFSTSGDKPSDIVGTIRLENINFSYPSRPDVRVLENLSLNVPTGKVTALVGASGSGKSTIVGLLERWYSPQAGTITLDGQPLDQLNLTWLRTNIRLVQQEPVIFSGTVFENIANGLMGSRFANNPIEDQRERVQEAAKEAFAHDFIMGLPHGYDTPVGERGGLLSGGQKQRIAIARSIVSKPKILLLDEATSALDPQAEGIVQKALDSASRDRTTIVIAHKLATICNADNIVVMSKGQVIEQGHHAELIEKNGQYANLVKAQDLSVMANEVDPDQTIHDDGSSQHGELAHTLTKNHTEDERHFEYLKDKDDFDLVPLTGLVHTICRLIQATPELRGWYALAVLACFASAAVYPGQVLLIASVMDLFTGPDVLDRGNFVALMFFVMGIGAFIGNFAMGWIANVIAQTLSYRCRKEILDDVLRQDLQFFDRPENTVGALTSRLDSYPQAVFELMGFNISLMLIAMVNIISCSILSIATSWKLGLVGVFAGLPPMLLAGYARIRVETKMDRDTDRRFSASASVASESVAAIRTISSLAIEETILQKYTEELDRAIRLSTGPLFQIMVWFSFTQSVEAFILALGFWWGCRLVSFDDISFYQFVVAFMGIYFCGQGGAQLFSHSSSFTKANSAANYYFWLRNLQPLVRETDNNVNQEAKDTCSSFDFKNVKFCYPLAPKVHVLQGVNIKIDRGQFVAFVGASGCGKSTIISLLERFYDPTSGTISTDGARLQDINPRLYRDNIALVQQEPTLFPGSIKDNIAMGLRAEERDSPNDDSIEAACRAANIWDFICSLPEGLDTLCGMGGSQLSGGQRQRIAIARALIRNPRVLLLDEATSALDTESEKLVQEALMSAASSSGRITIAVAHRLSTIRDADCIYVFQDGRIIDAGTHSELIGRGGLYKKMFEAQSLDQAA